MPAFTTSSSFNSATTTTAAATATATADPSSANANVGAPSIPSELLLLLLPILMLVFCLTWFWAKSRWFKRETGLLYKVLHPSPKPKVTLEQGGVEIITNDRDVMPPLSVSGVIPGGVGEHSVPNPSFTVSAASMPRRSSIPRSSPIVTDNSSQQQQQQQQRYRLSQLSIPQAAVTISTPSNEAFSQLRKHHSTIHISTPRSIGSRLSLSMNEAPSSPGGGGYDVNSIGALTPTTGGGGGFFGGGGGGSRPLSSYSSRSMGIVSVIANDEAPDYSPS